jgi:cytochrome P450 family 4
MGYIVMERILKPWLFSDTVFALSALKTTQKECLNVLHNMTSSVIRKRRQEIMAERATQSKERSKEDESGKV